jgi:release factor glutamine methyltransferase
MPEFKRTISGALHWGTHLLRAVGVESPRTDAELLLRKALEVDRVEIFLNPARLLTRPQFATYKSLIDKRVKGEPIHYILGGREFWSLELRVSADVLIPRPETELLVEEALRVFGQANNRTPRLMEVGTGSGAVAIALARELGNCFIVAEDICWRTVLVAMDNARAHGVLGTIRFLVGDLFESLKEGTSRFDLIICNPPYIPSAKIEDLPREIAEFEPRIALDGGPDGLQFFRRIVGESASFLEAGGWLMLELGEGQGEAVVDMIRDTGVFAAPHITGDYSGANRVIRARMG